MSLTAYIRYDSKGRIVPSGPIVTSVKPKVGDWVAVDDVLTTIPNYKLRGFIRYIKNGNYVAGSLILQHNEPQDGNWKEVYVLKPVQSNSYYTYSLGNGSTETAQCIIAPTYPTNYYSLDNPLVVGSLVYTDTSLTIPISTDIYFNTSMKFITIPAGGEISSFTNFGTVNTVYSCLGSNISQEDSCAGEFAGAVYVPCNTIFENGTRIYNNYGLSTAYTVHEYLAINGYTYTVTDYMGYSELGNKTAC